ncbi:MAG: cytochrome ubiquinol oxidase subunit I [Actinomycetia bacterium]|nr:cytochrome ubiquinol oxidase subunit I [Actinomycetes bacterium]
MLNVVLGVAEANLYAARYQMAISLGFHIILASFGVAYPFLTFLAHRLGYAKGDVAALRLAKRWSKAMAVLFAVGAVSGTILSFEMGMLWPGLMGPYGDVIGLPFALEGVSFFIEAIFIAIYLYGWKRLPAKLHMLTLLPMTIAGLTGSFFILAVNAWMNGPEGFSIAADGSIVDVDPWAAMFNSGVVVQWLHMLLAAYMMTGFLVASVYAIKWIKGDRSRITRLGFIIPFSVAAIAAPLQVVVGDVAARRLIDRQPVKFAAMELIPETRSNAPLTIGGLLIDGEVRWAIEVPGLASLLGTRDMDGEVPGLDVVGEADLPPVNVVHIAFQIMVAIGTGLVALAGWFGWSWLRRRGPPEARLFWYGAASAGVLALVALEAGWIVTEVGRQPWIVWEIVRTRDAVSESTGIIASAIAISLLYVVLGVITIAVLRVMSRRMEAGEDVETPYGPSEIDR